MCVPDPILVCCVHLLERFQGRAFGDGAGQGDSAVVADRVDLETVTPRPPTDARRGSQNIRGRLHAVDHGTATYMRVSRQRAVLAH